MESRVRRMKKICVLTGTRAEYGILKRIIKGIDKSKKLELKLFVTGMHLSRKFGYTFNEIKKDGYKVSYKANINPRSFKEESSMAQSIGKAITKTTKLFSKDKPDLVLMLGDRSEALAVAITAAYMNIPVAHIHGGDTTRAGLDESARHAITKFSHIHFPATKISASRIVKLGEDKWRIFMCGSPDLDSILHAKTPSLNDMSKELRVKLDSNFQLLIQHPVSTQPSEARRQVRETLNAIVKLKKQTIIIYPNSDVGGVDIIDEIDKYCKKYDFLHAYKSLKRDIYLGLLKNTSVIIGNSSSGIVESGGFKTPAVNIGIRQDGRERANNVINVKHNSKDIQKAIKKATSKEFILKVKKCKSPYGDGKASEKIVKKLEEINLSDKKLLEKKITY